VTEYRPERRKGKKRRDLTAFQFPKTIVEIREKAQDAQRKRTGEDALQFKKRGRKPKDKPPKHRESRKLRTSPQMFKEKQQKYVLLVNSGVENGTT